MKQRYCLTGLVRGPVMGSVLATLLCLAIAVGVSRGQAQAPESDQPAMTLADLERMALESNPTLAQAAANVREAEGRRLQSGLYPNPTIGYVGEEIRGGSLRGGQQGFFIRQDIVLGGKLGLNRRIFEYEKSQAEVEAEEQRLRVLTNVRLSYIRVLAAQETLELQRNLNRLTQEAAQISVRLANVGQADAPDVLAAEVEAQQTELGVFTAEQDQRRVWRQLAAVLGRPELPLGRLEGDLEAAAAVAVDPDELVEKMASESPAVRIAELGVLRAEAALARARREPIPNLQFRGGLQQDRALSEFTGKPVGLQGFAEVGVQIPIFNRNQGKVAAARADLERARQEVVRVKLVLRERAADFVQAYETSREAAGRYKDQILPRAGQAYELYLSRYRQMSAAYPQVLIAQRTLMRLQVAYIATLENLRSSALVLQSYLLTDGLEGPTRPGDLDRPVRELNVPNSFSINAQE